MSGDLAIDPDGTGRCSWALSSLELREYHDNEWGLPVTDDNGLFERICLEAFQCGLSWLIVLRKREAFRRGFANFEIEVVARFDDKDVARLLADPGIVRNRGKIVASIENARRSQEVIAELGSLAQLIWQYLPQETPAPCSYKDLPTVTPESAALAKELKRRGFRFLGPTTVCALMQACGLINAHLAGCHARERVDAARAKARKRLGLA
ncbi:MAG TPA: DNA-3-methyladenine glycosylase I [Gaiellaceae bacterium]